MLYAVKLGQGLGFEYDGVQHSKESAMFHKNGAKDLEYQIKKDSWKDAMCKKHGIMLIRIPHYVHKDDLEDYIISKLKKNDVYPRSNDTKWDQRRNMYN